jgi:hypothetical protein
MSSSTRIFILVLLLQIGFAKGQTTHILKGKASDKKLEGAGLYFIHNETDSSGVNYVATLQVNGAEGRATMGDLYHTLKRKANQMGANGFNKIIYNETNNTLQSDVYFLTDSALKNNSKFEASNKVYVFGRVRPSNKKLKFIFNDQPVAIRGGEYFSYEIPEGQEVTLSKGGARSGAKIKWKESSPAVYFSVSGFDIADNAVPAYNNSSTLAFTTGGLSSVDSGFGHVLLQYLKPMAEVKH